MNFIKHFFKSAKYTGAIAPSSRFLAREIITRSNINQAKIVIELGPGTGPITKEILNELSSDCKLITFDINEEFVKHLKTNYPSAEHVCADIRNLQDHLGKRNITSAELIISGIPFVDFSKQDCNAMLSQISEIMSHRSLFILFTYSPIKFKALFSWFEKVEMTYVPLNLPPAFILVLKKKTRLG